MHFILLQPSQGKITAGALLLKVRLGSSWLVKEYDPLQVELQKTGVWSQTGNVYFTHEGATIGTTHSTFANH